MERLLKKISLHELKNKIFGNLKSSTRFGETSVFSKNLSVFSKKLKTNTKRKKVSLFYKEKVL